MTTLTDRLEPVRDDPARDTFLRSSPFAAYQQSAIWAQVAPRGERHEFLAWTCRDGDAIVAAAIVRRTWLASGFWLATLQRGPVVADAARLAAVVPRLIATLDRHGCCSMQLCPRVRGRALPVMTEAMRAAGFTPLGEDRQPLHRATGIVWLDKPEADILAGFRQRGRRQVRAAEKAGIVVRPVAGTADLATFQSLLDAFRAARPDYDMSGLPDATGQAALIDALGGGMLLAEIDGVPIGAHAFVRQADEAIWLSLATDETRPDLPRAYALLWEGMRHARALGCVGYDLAGMPVEDPRDPGEAGRMQFKTAFAPSRRIMPPMQVRAVKPAAHLVLFRAREVYRGIRRRRRAAA